MAVRIPVYERHVQLDAAAQTLPRVHGTPEVGKAILGLGNSMMAVAAHWKAKQDSFEKLQMHQNVGILQAQLAQITTEETLKFNPATDAPGTLHDRIAARTQEAINQFYGNAPDNLKSEYGVYANTLQQQQSIHAASQESTARNSYGTAYLDKLNGQILKQVEANPDSAHQAVNQMRKAIRDTAAAGNLTAAQQEKMDTGYSTAIAKSATGAFVKQGRTADANAFIDQFVTARNAEGIDKIKNRVDPNRYETPLSPDEEQGFRDWKSKYAPNDSGKDYDLRGAYKAGVTPDQASGHFPDTFKKPNHPTFSDQSQYAKDRPDLAGHWEGDTFVPPKAQAPGTSPTGAQPSQPGPQTSVPDTALNQKRIAQIDAMPEVKAAIEKAAAANGLDPNALKVFASIESSGNPKDVTGSHHGLFNLTKAEFGMNGGGNIYDATDNANAAAKLLAQKKEQLTTQLGREPSATELYGAHNQGMGGVTAHLQNPDQPAWKSMLQTKEGQDRIASDGQAGAEKWAKAAIDGNVPSDVTKRLYGGDSSSITSKEFMAIQGTRVKGGGIDEAITNARQEPSTGRVPGTVTASADGTVINDTRPPSYVGGINVGGPAPTIGGYKAASESRLDETAAHGYTRGGVSVAPWLVDSVRQASQTLPPGYTVKVISTVDPRSTGTVWHPSGRAIDIQIYDDKGKPVPNVGPPGVPGYDIYKDMAASAKAYAADKYGKDMTWGGHFNTGTPYDRMHFQVGGAEGGGSARQFTPEELDAGRQRIATVAQPGTVQVAGPGAPTGTTPVVGGSNWDQLGTSLKNQVDGGSMKAAAIQQAMKVSLQNRIKSDIVATQVNGDGIKLTPDLQKYYGTDQLSYDFISSKLGTGAAIQWQQNKDFAQKVFNGGANMEQMPRSGIIDRLNQMTPDANSPNYLDQVKVYGEVLKKAKKIDFDRNSDPAAAADKDPVVQEKLQDALKDPTNQDKIQALVTARMSAQEHMGIPETLRTPITNDQAKQLAEPLLNRARPDREAAPSQVADNIVKMIGKTTAEGVPNLQQRALETVLKNQKITNDQAAATADALAAAQHPPAAPLIPAQMKPKNYDLSYMAKDGYFVDPQTGLATSYGPPEHKETYTHDTGKIDEFHPGTRFIPGDHINTLKGDPSLADVFDSHYGDGAAAHFLSGGKNVDGAQPLATATPQDALSQPAPDAFAMPAQPDALAPDETKPPDQTTDEETSGAL